MSSMLEKPDRSARKQQKAILSAPTAPPGEKENLAQFPMSFPRRGLRIERLKGGLRKIDL
jgi:hypothetical protein